MYKIKDVYAYKESLEREIEYLEGMRDMMRYEGNHYAADLYSDQLIDFRFALDCVEAYERGEITPEQVAYLEGFERGVGETELNNLRYDACHVEPVTPNNDISWFTESAY